MDSNTTVIEVSDRSEARPALLAAFPEPTAEMVEVIDSFAAEIMASGQTRYYSDYLDAWVTL